MTSIEIAACDAAATALSLPDGDTDEERQAIAEDAAYHAAVQAGASRADAAELAPKIVAEMTWDLHDSRGPSFDAYSNSRH